MTKQQKHRVTMALRGLYLAGSGLQGIAAVMNEMEMARELELEIPEALGKNSTRTSLIDASMALQDYLMDRIDDLRRLAGVDEDSIWSQG